MSFDLLVLAAGLGVRFGGAKQLEPIGPAGEILLDYTVFDAARAGARRAVFVIRREMEAAFHAVHGRRYASRLEVAYAFQDAADVPEPGMATGRERPWGTGHAVLAARRALPAPFLVANADDLYGAEAIAALARFVDSGADPALHAMVAYPLGSTLSAEGPVSRALCDVGPAGALRGLREHLGIERVGAVLRGRDAAGGEVRLTGEEPASMNLWGFHPSILAPLAARFAAFLAERGRDRESEFFLPTAIDELVRAGAARVRVLRAAGPCPGLTHPGDRAALGRHLAALHAAGAYPARLWG